VVEVTLIEASRRAALQEMRRDERVWGVFVEDVACRHKNFPAVQNAGAVAWSR
jgi:pyruvate/2-oxoglutarate/acetoin dehydrogenase E1 component